MKPRPFSTQVVRPFDSGMTHSSRVLLIDSVAETRAVIARRLAAQGYVVEEVADAATGADIALCSPPAAVIAELWNPDISGIQLCRLLRSEPGTADVAMILCGESDEPRDRFWSEKAGADAYVPKRRSGELVRTLARTLSTRSASEGFFMQLADGTVDVRKRISRHLDRALSDAVLASEVRALASAASFERLFDSLVQFVSQVTRYRWLALYSDASLRIGLHHHPNAAATAESEAIAAIAPRSAHTLLRIEDEDAADAPLVPAIAKPITFGNATVGWLALAPVASDIEEAERITSGVAREIGGALRIAELVEESQRIAATDPLTGLMNRRAFTAALKIDMARAQRTGQPFSLVLLDIDHFKAINDNRGHAAGDRALAALGRHLLTAARATDIVARWGGEEFVVGYAFAGSQAASCAAERLRCEIRDLVVLDEAGVRIPITASLGVATLRDGENLDEFIDRADRAMYSAKTSGRNRVCASPAELEDNGAPAREVA